MHTLFSRFTKLIIILLVISGFVIALLPTIMSTEWGRGQVIYWINRSIPGKVEIRHLTLHWGKEQVLEGILLKDPEGQSVLEIEKFSTEATLWQLLRKSTNLGFTKIQELNAAIVTDDKGRTNLQRALGIPSSADIPPLPPSTIILSDINAELDLFAKNHPLSAWIKGMTRQANLNGSFEINLVLTGLQAGNWENLKENAQNYLTIEGSKEAKFQARVINFPVDLIDRLVALKNSHLNGLFHSILGDRLNLTIDKEPSQEGLAFNLTALAPLMQGEMKGKVANGVLTLQEPATFHFNLIPESINPFTHHRFELLNSSRLKVNFLTLSLPLNFLDDQIKVDPCLFVFEAEATLPETTLDIYPLGKLNILTLQASFHAPSCDKEIHLQVIGKAQQGKEPFEISFNSTLRKPQNFSQLLQQLSHPLHSDLKIFHLPFQLLPFLQEYPALKEHVGPHVDAQLTIVPKGKEEWEATLFLQTPRLTLKEAKFRLGKDLVLIAPAQVDWIAPAHFLQSLLKAEKWALDEPFPLKFVLKQLHIPLDHPNFTKYQLESTIPYLQFSKLVPWGKWKIEDIFFKINGQNLHQFNSQLNGQLAFLDLEGSYSSLIKDPLKFTQTAFWKLGPDKTIEMASSHLQVNNSLTTIQLDGRLSAHHLFELTQPVEIQYTLTPSALQTLSQLLAKKWPTLQESTQLNLTIDPTIIDLTSFSFASLKIQGALALDHIKLHDASETYSNLENIGLSWVFDAPMNNFYANVKGSVYSKKNTKPSPLSAYIQFWPEFGQYDLTHTQTEFRLNCAGLPTSFLNILLNTDDLSPVLGPILDVNVKTFFDPTNKKSGYWDILLDSAYFHLKGRFRLEEGATIFDLNKLPTVHLSITPESYNYLKKLFAFQDERKLAMPFTIACNLAELYFPFIEPWTDQFKIDLQLSSTTIEWQGSSTQPVILEGQVMTQHLPEHLYFSIKADSSSPIILQGTLKNVVDAQGHLRKWQEMDITLNTQGSQLTPQFVQNLLFLNSEQTQKMQALLGESFDFSANCQIQNLNGPLQLSLKGTQGQLDLDGQLKQGILTLRRPLEGFVKMSPLLSQVFLAPNLPLLSSAIGAENPLKFTIDPSQFSCPLFPFKMEEVKIGKGTLDLGKIRFRNEGELSSVLKLIRSISEPSLTIWFTPLYFQLDRGVLNFQRLDMLVAHMYTLATWGTLNLNTQQAQLMLGISAQTLGYAFGIQGLDEDYMLQISMFTKNGKVEIDKKKVTGKISSLFAQTQGKTGKLLGDLLNLALSTQDDTSPPLPTTQPFPWHEEFSPQSPSQQKTDDEQSSNTQQNSDKKKKKSKHKSFKESALQLLDQF